MASTSVVLPTPGPPVMTVAFEVSANRTASAWPGASDRPALLLDPGQRPLDVDVRPGELASHKVDEPLGDRPLGLVQAAEEHARRVRDGVCDDGVFGQLQLESGSERIVGHVEQAGRQRAELVGRQSAVAVVHRLGQRVADAGAHPGHRRPGDSQLHRDRVGDPEPDTANVAGEAVRVLRDDLDRVAPAGLEDPHRPRRAHAMAVQEDHALANRFLLGPRVGDAPGANLADAGDLAKPFGLGLDDVEHLVAERLHQLAGVDLADAAYHARAQVLLDALGRRRRRAAQEVRLELVAVGAVVDPLPGCGGPLPGRDRGGRRR